MTAAKLAADCLRKNKWHLVTAESCTAGLIASTLADLPGAGELLDCAFVTYSPAAKQRCLQVSAATIRRFNLTSEEVAREMVRGALRNSRANVGIANTGVTDSIDPDIPAGTQCFAWAFKRTGGGPARVFSETVVFKGSRNSIRIAAARHALRRLSDFAVG